MYTHVEFPNLLIDLTMNRRLVEFDALGGGIYYYAVIICLGFVLAWLYISHIDKKSGHSLDNLLDVVLYSVPAAIIGARLYYVIFSFENYKDNLIDIFKIWEGGLAIYGGVIASSIAIFIYCHIKKLSALHYLDLAGSGLFIGQAVGRWGNFVNGEAHGIVCSDSFLLGMKINGEGPFHPTFLYESLLNILGFTILHFLAKKFRFDGFRIGFYCIWYGLVRFFLEGLRTDSLFIPGTGIRTSQLFSLLLAIAGAVLLIIRFKKQRQKISE